MGAQSQAWHTPPNELALTDTIMNRHTFNDGHNTYTRISKRIAKLRFNAGVPFCIIGCNLVPGYPFAQHMTITSGREWMEHADWYAPDGITPNPTLWKGTREETAWDLFYNNWAYYNLSHGEEGRYASYYIEQPNKDITTPCTTDTQTTQSSHT